MNDKLLKISSLLLFHTSFVYLDDGSGIGRVIQAASLFLLVAILIQKRKYKLLPEFKKINKLVVFYCISLLLTSYMSNNINMGYLDRFNLGTGDELRLSSYSLGVLQSLSVLTSFIFVEYLSSINKTKILFNTFFKISFFYIILSDIMFLAIGTSGQEGYLIGNKFSLCYMHIYCYIFYIVSSLKKQVNPNKIIRRILIIMTVIISMLSECTTTLLGIFMIVSLLNHRKGFGRTLFKIKTYLFILFIGVLFIFFYNIILDIEFVQYFIVNVLHEDLTLTGRTDIYDSLLPVIFMRPLLGFGVGNAHWILAYLLNVANAQNGLVNLYIEEGLIGTVLYLFIFIAIFKYIKERIPFNMTYPILCCIMLFFFLGLVEITIDNKLLIVISFLLAYDYNKLVPYAKN